MCGLYVSRSPDRCFNGAVCVCVLREPGFCMFEQRICVCVLCGNLGPSRLINTSVCVCVCVFCVNLESCRQWRRYSMNGQPFGTILYAICTLQRVSLLSDTKMYLTTDISCAFVICLGGFPPQRSS